MLQKRLEQTNSLYHSMEPLNFFHPKLEPPRSLLRLKPSSSLHLSLEPTSSVNPLKPRLILNMSCIMICNLEPPNSPRPSLSRRASSSKPGAADLRFSQTRTAVLPQSRLGDAGLSTFQLEVAELPPSNHGAADLIPSQPRTDELRQSEADTADIPQSPVS